MRWTLKLGRVAGIQIYMHLTFLVLLGWIFLAHLGRGESVSMAVRGVALVLALFVCIVLHELGHALTARRYNIHTRDITLLPIGGVARLERMPREPTQELCIALAGPAVNVFIAAFLFIVALIAGLDVSALDAFKQRATFIGSLISLNLWVVFFNLIPAFPMDGGRVLRAVLAWVMNYARATAIAARVGQVLAILFFLAAFLVPAPLLVLVALFVFLGAHQEAELVKVTSTLRGIRVHDAMITHFHTLSPNDSLSVAASELITSSQHDFPVLEGENVVGILTRSDLVKALAHDGADAKVSSAMRPDCKAVPEDEQLEKSYELLQQNHCSTLPVINDGRRLVGIITLDNITEWMLVNTALHRAGAARLT